MLKLDTPVHISPWLCCIMVFGYFVLYLYVDCSEEFQIVSGENVGRSLN